MKETRMTEKLLKKLKLDWKSVPPTGKMVATLATANLGPHHKIHVNIAQDELYYTYTDGSGIWAYSSTYADLEECMLEAEEEMIGVQVKLLKLAAKNLTKLGINPADKIGEETV